MTKITLMGAGSAGTSHGQNYHSGGQANNKWQGLPATRNSRTGPLLTHIRSQAGSTEEQRRAVYYFNALGGVGKMRSQFIGGAGGAFDPDKEKPETIKFWYDTAGYSYAAKFVNLKDIAFDLSGTYGLPEGVESWDDVDIIEITRGSAQNKTKTRSGPLAATEAVLQSLSDPSHPVYSQITSTWNGYTSAKALYGQIAALLRSYKTSIPDNNENYLNTSGFPDYMFFDPRGVGTQYESANNIVYTTLDQKNHFNTILDPSSSTEVLLYKTGTFLTKHSPPMHIGTDVSAQEHNTLPGALETTYMAHYNQLQEKIENDHADASFNKTSSGPGVFTTIGGIDLKDINKVFLKGLVSNGTLPNAAGTTIENDQSIFNETYPASELRPNAGMDSMNYNPRYINRNANAYHPGQHFNTTASYDVRNNIRYILVDKKDNYSIREEDPSYQTSYNIYKPSKQGEAFVYAVEMSPDSDKWLNWTTTVNDAGKYSELFNASKIITRPADDTVKMLSQLYNDYQKTNMPLNFELGDVKVIGKVKDIYDIYTSTPWKPYDSSGSSSNVLSGDSIADSSGGFGTFVSIDKGEGDYVAVASRETADKIRFYKTTTTTDNKTYINLLESQLVKDRFPISEASGNNIISISDYSTGFTPLVAVGEKNATRPSFGKSSAAGTTSTKGGYVELFGNDFASSATLFSIKTKQKPPFTSNYTELFGEVEGDAYGNSVAIAGSIGTSAMMVVGAPDASGGIGHTYVYQIGGSTGGNVLVDNVITAVAGISGEQSGVYTLDAFVGDGTNKNYGYSVDVAKMTDNSFVVVSGAPSYSDLSQFGDIRYQVFDQLGNKVQDVSNVYSTISPLLSGGGLSGELFGSQVSLSDTGEFMAIVAPQRPSGSGGASSNIIYMRWNPSTSKYQFENTFSGNADTFSIIREVNTKYLDGTNSVDRAVFLSNSTAQQADFFRKSSWTRENTNEIITETPSGIDKKGAGLAVGKNGNIVVVGAPSDGKGSVEVLQLPYPKLDLTIKERQVGNDMSCPNIGGVAGDGQYGYEMTIDALAKHYAISGPEKCGKWTSGNGSGWVDIYDVSGSNIDNYTEVASFVRPWFLNETKNTSGQYPSSGGSTYQAAEGSWMTGSNSQIAYLGGAGMGQALEYSGDGKVLVVGLPLADKIAGSSSGSSNRGAIYVVQDRGVNPSSGLRFGNRAFHHQARQLANGGFLTTALPKAYLTPNEIAGFDVSANFGASVSSNYDGSIIAACAGDVNNPVKISQNSFAEVLYYNTSRSPPLYEYRAFKTSGSNKHREPGYAFCSLSADGNRVALSNPYYDISGGATNAGIVSVFEWDEVNKVYEKIGGDIIGTATNDAVGNQIKLSPSGKVVVIGSSGKIGSYTLYEGNTGTWTKVYEYSGSPTSIYNFSTSGYHSEEIAYIDPSAFPNGRKITFMCGSAYEDFWKVPSTGVMSYSYRKNAYESGFQKATTSSSFNSGTTATANVEYPDGAGDGAVANTVLFSKYNSIPAESIATLVTDIY
uniref:Uncharacterized protein n=1 Tax=viral metagenome TaxID=1070528 RepID=A0A6C0CPW6_9ZZZZ